MALTNPFAGFQTLAESIKKKREAEAPNSMIPSAPQSTPYQFTPSSYKPIFQNEAKPVSYQATTFKAPDLKSTVQPAYNQMRNQTMTAGKQSMRSGLEMARDMMGRRNVNGGVATMAGNAAVDPVQRNTLSEMANLNLQEARDMSNLEQNKAAYDWQAQTANAGEKQYATEVAKYNAEQKQRQYELENQLANLDRQMDYEEWANGRQIDMAEREARRQEIISQFEIDQSLRNEEYQREMAPLQYLMQLYGINAGQQQGSSSNGSPGIFDMIGSGAGMIGGIGGLLSGGKK